VIIDTHLHVWERSSERYPWKPLADVAPDYAWPIEKEIEVMDKYGIDQGVIVQPSMYSFNNDYIIQCGRSFPNRFALIGLVNPVSEALEQDMDNLADKGIKGLRLAPKLRPDLVWYNDDHADLLWRKAQQLDLILTLLIGPDQILDARKAIERFPEVKVVIDHLARPDLEEDPERPLFGNLLELALFDRVYVKLSALGFMSKRRYPHRDMLELIKRTFDAFGPERLMWGTDTPMSTDPDAVPCEVRLMELALPEIPEDDREKILGYTAATLFGLN
jgi:L-fuconolactonase